MKLIEMIDFVLEQKFGVGNQIISKDVFYDKVSNYTNFLKQTRELWMFVPCDEDGNVLEEPKHNGTLGLWARQKEYQQAKERCLFEGFEVGVYPLERYIMHQDGFGLVIEDLKKQTVRDLVKYNLKLTQTGEKQIEYDTTN